MGRRQGPGYCGLGKFLTQSRSPLTGCLRRCPGLLTKSWLLWDWVSPKLKQEATHWLVKMLLWGAYKVLAAVGLGLGKS
jgi:hypothetical protein